MSCSLNGGEVHAEPAEGSAGVMLYTAVPSLCDSSAKLMAQGLKLDDL